VGDEAERCVLVVDDDPDIAELIAAMLGRSGWRTAVAGGAAAASAALEDQRPDLFVLDAHMPVVDGLQLCRELRTNRSTASIPVLMVSAGTSVEQVAAAYGAGADDFLGKPFSRRDLLEKVERLVRADSEQWRPRQRATKP
jgi:DNA-binding response OmpR family regulator